ncbi:hypothetical protein KFK09_019517 [Dendrobium nobile]|uniref:Uncharacterized protein n=1 Tax=Dendrobium nobile TaxID=94219 RepID=A0A8T3AR66_DENNO|nr:hypothetical protein KFK09_019517 [Dendrobium nobile]
MLTLYFPCPDWFGWWFLGLFGFPIFNYKYVMFCFKKRRLCGNFWDKNMRFFFFLEKACKLVSFFFFFFLGKLASLSSLRLHLGLLIYFFSTQVATPSASEIASKERDM